jgi:2-dehydro-3-deoxygluconokinase
MPAPKTLDLIAIGEPLIEFNQDPADPARYRAGYGGDTSNCAIAAARLGARVGYLTQVGDDAFGQQLLDLWAKEGVDTSGVRTLAGGDTGLYFVTHGERGHAFTYRRAGSAAARMTAADLSLARVADAKYLHVSGISQAISSNACDTVFEAIAQARSNGTRVSYDLNFRPRLWPAPRALAIARETLALCDVFFPSVDEIGMLTGLNTPEDIVRWSHAQGARIVVLKLGAQGSLLSTAEGAQRIAPLPVQPVDATGAGDCFAGAFLARSAAGDSPLDAARAANVAAALSTQGYGAVAPLPRWSEVAARLAGIP